VLLEAVPHCFPSAAHPAPASPSRPLLWAPGKASLILPDEHFLHAGSRKDSIPQVLLPEEEKIIIEETRSNGQTVTEEK